MSPLPINTCRGCHLSSPWVITVYHSKQSTENNCIRNVRILAGGLPLADKSMDLRYFSFFFQIFSRFFNNFPGIFWNSDILLRQREPACRELSFNRSHANFWIFRNFLVFLEFFQNFPEFWGLVYRVVILGSGRIQQYPSNGSSVKPAQFTKIPCWKCNRDYSFNNVHCLNLHFSLHLQNVQSFSSLACLQGTPKTLGWGPHPQKWANFQIT